ncbi:hypothetical protein A7A09_019770 [Paracoccus methylarcula]|uniref:Uncharacterized protein n=2 Tax=Paracoccus methylarcula TaxID=72022 RepID=A0A422QSC3_9RHOB|nr:hypothetical protein A7A09_019770 [Paracoccus methylarcula]
MLIPAFLTVAATALPDVSETSPEVSAFMEEASAWLLDGKGLAPNYRQLLQQMEPADRLQAIIFLRRSGLLTGDIWSLEDVLRPVPAPAQPPVPTQSPAPDEASE